MAKKKKGGKVKYRRMGVASSVNLNKTEDLLMLAGGVVAGGIAKGFVDQTLAKQDQIKINQNLVDGLQVVAGGAAAIMLKHPFFKGAGIGLGTAATLSALRTAGVIKGGSFPMVPFRPRPNQARTLNGGVTATPSVAGSNPYGFPQPPGVGRSLRRKVGGY